MAGPYIQIFTEFLYICVDACQLREGAPAYDVLYNAGLDSPRAESHPVPSKYSTVYFSGAFWRFPTRFRLSFLIAGTSAPSVPSSQTIQVSSSDLR